MHRKLVAAVHELTPAQRDAIRRAALAHGFDAAFYETNAEAAEAASDAEVMLANAPELASAAPNLRWMCTPSAGADQFAGVEPFATQGATLTNSSGAYGVTIAEHIVMVTLELMRRQQDYADIVRRREWTRSLPVRSIRGSRIALLGTGDIGRETAKRLRGFQPRRVVGVNRGGHNPEELFDAAVPINDLDHLLPETDLLVMSLPGTPETRRTMSAERLALLPDGAIIVNVGRGSAIDEAALLAELQRGRLRAALDVFETEPLPPDSPLWNCPNLLITPHVAGNMTLPYTVDRIVQLFLEDFENYCAGKPLARRVDLKKGY